MKVLVTGGAGFIGSNFIRYILRDLHPELVVNFDALTYAGNLQSLMDVSHDPRYVFIHGNICDRQAVEAVIRTRQIDTIVNFAAESHVDRSILDAQPFLKSNVLGAGVLLDAVKHYGVKRFIQISTDEVYGPVTNKQCFDEKSRLNPTSPYAATKAAADLLALSYYKTFGLDIRITRSTNNYGPYQFPEKLVPLMTTNALRGLPLPLYGDGHYVRDWLHVIDNCRAIAAVMTRGRAGNIYNIAGQNDQTNKQVTRVITHQLRELAPKVVAVADRPANDEGYRIDDSKVRRELNWRPEMTFQLGLGDTIDWYVINRDWWEPLLKRVKNR